MTSNKRWLSFVLAEEGTFDELLCKFERAFQQPLICHDDKGRYIACAVCQGFEIKVIDKEDRLSELLCDEHYVLDVIISSDDHFNEAFEARIKALLSDHALQWTRRRWAPHPLP
ncbi:hypothetical protein [Kosakonia sp.]|uniref:hypothetical protein n=1 Tax=Kosakonia sp. TaxID=1916651 RepID=UPI00289B3795|nr:hypothetical protein [Kosakonia sp.]